MDKESKEAVADLIAQKMIAPDALANDIEKISRAVRTLLTGRLKFPSLVSIIAMDAKVPKKTVEKVLEAAMQLDERHLTKEKKERK